MSYPLPLLVWLRTFEACVRQQSFARAADELGVTAAAVSQHIKALESHLGIQLFDRQARGVSPTTLARAYYPSVQRSLDDLVISTTGLFGPTSRRTLVIRSSVAFAGLCLAPRLPDFRRRFPGIQLRLYASILSHDLDDTRVDFEIRYGRGHWDGYESDRLCDAVSIPVCPADTDFGRDPAKTLATVVRQHPVHIIGCENMWTIMARRHGWPESAVAGGSYVDSSVTALEMVGAGEGAAMVLRDLVSHHIERGRVVAPPDLSLETDSTYYLLMPSDARVRSADALVFRDWLLDAMGTAPSRAVRA